jgi:hypothetical protein
MLTGNPVLRAELATNPPLAERLTSPPRNLPLVVRLAERTTNLRKNPPLADLSTNPQRSLLLAGLVTRSENFTALIVVVLGW